MIDWQPIKSAPRDGSFFLAWWPNEDHPEQIRVTHWNRTWQDEAGVVSMWVDVNGDWMGSRPSHWAPLPAGPKRARRAALGEQP